MNREMISMTGMMPTSIGKIIIEAEYKLHKKVIVRDFDGNIISEEN